MPMHSSNIYTIHELQENAQDILHLVEEAANKQIKGAKMDLMSKWHDGGVWCEQGEIAGCSGGTFDNVMAAADILRGKSCGNGAFSLSVYPGSLSAVCAIVCNHEKQCAGNCIRGRKDTPVHFSSNEAYISDMYLDRMTLPTPEKKDKKVAVIGMGNAAMDVARTALRHGSRHVTLYARSKNVTASSSEVAYTELDGAEFVFGMQIEKITDEGPVFKRAIFDENDQIVGYEDEPVQVHADSTVISISQVPRRKLVRTTEGLFAGERGTLLVDENYMTTKPGVFAAGDMITGAKTVVHVVDGAKKAAEAMIRYMEAQS